ncbi:hypothetical protein BH11ARM2_BH11ARM2_24160 [soil metagenome]
MPLYQYRARDLSGAMMAGQIFAEDEATLRSHLRSSSLFLVNYRKSLDTGPKAARAPIRRKRVKLAVLAVASRQLATLVRAGTSHH